MASMSARSRRAPRSRSASAFWRRGVGVRRLLGRHRPVQIRAPRPRLAPVADRAVRVALPRLAKRPHRLRLGERVHHLEALVEERLRLLVGRGDRLGERAEPGLEDLNRLGVAVVQRSCRWRLRDGRRGDEQSDASSSGATVERPLMAGTSGTGTGSQDHTAGSRGCEGCERCNRCDRCLNAWVRLHLSRILSHPSHLSYVSVIDCTGSTSTARIAGIAQASRATVNSPTVPAR